MLQPPSRILVTIGATRMHRSLVDFASRSTDKTALRTKGMETPSTPMDRMEVTVHVVSEQYQTP